VRGAIVALFWAVLGLVAPQQALATVHHFVVAIGNDDGREGEVGLRYAESDAAKIADVFRDLGGVPSSQIVVLKGEDADTARKEIVAINERIRLAVQAPDDQATLVVFYSGHADASALHLGGTDFELRELEQLVRGSAANHRLLIVDACKSGALTRVKGAEKAPPVAIRADLSLAAQGAVFLTSSAAGEDAQESDTIKGSFFTHYLVSALRGAGDRDGDGDVTVEEAFEYAHDATLRATSSSAIGVQHPTFRYEVRGRTGHVLTRPLVAQKSAKLTFPPGKTYLVFSGSDRGPVVGEVSSQATSRTIAVRPGSYFIRARASDHLLEGSFDVSAGSAMTLDESSLKRADYARLVRKGGAEDGLSHGPRAGYSFRTPIVEGASLCHGATAGWAIASEYLEIEPAVGFCRGTLENDTLRATQDDFMGLVSAAYVFDVPVVSFALGLALGGGVLHQSFETEGIAPARTTGFGRLGAFGRIDVDLTEGFYLGGRVEAETTLFMLRVEDVDELAARVAVRPTFLLGKWL
jgi:hypothetical protein